MKKTIITVFAFMIIFGFAASGTMAQTWEIWKFTIVPPPPTTPIFVDIQVGGSWLQGTEDNTVPEPVWSDLTQDTKVSDPAWTTLNNVALETVLDSILGPNGVEYAIDENTVFYRLPTCQPDGPENELIAFAVQPIVPADGKFVAIAVNENGTV